MASASLAFVVWNQGAAAADVSWVGGVVGDEEDWHSAGYWSTGAVPTGADNVLVDVGPGVVILDEASALTLALEYGLRVDRDGKLTVGSGISHAGPGYFINDGQIDADILNDAYIASSFRMGGDLTNGENGGVVNQGLLDDRGPAIWTGDVVSNKGQIYNSTGQWNGTLLNESSGYIHNYDNSSWQGDVLGNADGGLIHNADTSIWRGDVVNDGAILNDGRADAAGSPRWVGNVIENGGSIFNKHAIWDGVVEDNQNYLENTDGAIWTGDIRSNTGRVFNIDSVWNGDVLGNGGTISSNGIWNGSITSSGTLRLANEVNGEIDNSGTLMVRGDLAGITLLSNTGILDLTSNTTPETLQAQRASFGDTAVYSVGIDAAGQSDQILIDGTATLGGTVAVKVAPGIYARSSTYRILSAASVVGTFSGVTTDLAFMAPRLVYSDIDVDLLLVRNDQGLATAGATPNQQHVAVALEELGSGNPLYDAVLWLTQPEAEQAFDALSGEIYPASEAGALQDSRVMRDIALDRVRQLLSADDAEPLASAGADGFWTQFYGATGDASIGAQSLASSTGGLVVGIDGSAADWQLGFMLHGGRTSTSMAAQGSTITGDDYGVGLYGGRSWGDTQLALGADYTRHMLHSKRAIAFAGFADTTSASYDGGTAQAFAELSHAFHHGSTSLVPYARGAYVGQATDGFAEDGGAAALSRADSFIDATFTVLGLRAEQTAAIGDTMALTASATLGWQHAFASPSNQTLSFSGASFEIAGTDIGRDSLVVGAGLNLAVGEAVNLDVNYSGHLGSDANSHLFKADWSIRF